MESPAISRPKEPGDLRRAFACFATGVTVVTLLDRVGDPFGMTVNSFTPLSLEPPLISWAIQKRSSALADVTDAAMFVVNILGAGHQLLSERFAGKGDRKLLLDDYFVSDCGNPVLSDAIASFECARDATYEVGDHLMIVGEVRGLGVRPLPSPLIFFGGKYRTIRQHLEE